MLDLSSCLNINQSPSELADLYGEKDYYWYLRSPEFRESFLIPLKNLLFPFTRVVLDVGCGEGQFGSVWDGIYCGLDGSPNAIRRGRDANPTLDIRFGRMEYPSMSFSPQAKFHSILFGGILEVLIKPEKRIEFISGYIRQFQASYFAVYDLTRLDTYRIDKLWGCIGETHLTCTSPEIAGKIPEVKLNRKVLIYRCR